jgi:DNA-binding NarL/FixJ family response regulator
MINVLIVEDSIIVAKGLQESLEKTYRYQVTALIENAANAEIICMGGNVDLVLMDICTADDESGITAAASIKKHYPEIKIIMMTSMPEYSFLEKARQAGADSFLYKQIGQSEFQDIVNRTMHGEHIYPDETPQVMIGNIPSTVLTRRELEVLRMLANGDKYEEIAEQLSISVNTVKFHVKNLLAKTGLRNTLQMVVEAVDKRLVLPKY